MSDGGAMPGGPEPPAAAAITEPGLYPGMPAEVYHADPWPGGSLSSSGARRILRSPATFRYGPDTSTPAMEFGTAAHAQVLGAGAEVVEVAGAASNGAWSTNTAKEAVAAARAAGQVPVKPEEFRRIKAMAAALAEHRSAADLFAGDSGAPEVSGFWEDPVTGVMRRVRFDFLPHGSGGLVVLPDYKALWVDTPLPTPSGWTTMGEVRPGDLLLDASGQPCRVTGKSPVFRQRRCYRVRFDDGSEVICDNEHLWAVSSGRRNLRAQVLTTGQIRQTLRRQGRCQHRIPVASALDLPAADLPADPWVLGYWLGNGTRGTGNMSCHEDDGQEIAAMAAAAGYPVSVHPETGGKRGVRVHVSRLRKPLAGLGVLGSKHVPAAYLRGSYEQRLALLRGLMDSDGCWNTGKRQALFTSTSLVLARAVRELACSLGQRAIIRPYIGHGFGKTVQAYEVKFTPVDLVPFALSRKAGRVPASSPARSRRRLIVAVEETLTVPVQCVMVDSPDSTYLCTEAMIPTHNTTKDASWDAVSKQIARMGYHLQGAWYADGVRHFRPGAEVRFVLVVQETDPPYLVACYQLDADALAEGARRNAIALEKYRDCRASGRWPGYDPDEGITLIGLPTWGYVPSYQDW